VNDRRVYIALEPKGVRGTEIRNLNQCFRAEDGAEEGVLDGARAATRAGFAVFVLAGTNHP
jgi:hypothetical protein